jgi:hypothetical protein
MPNDHFLQNNDYFSMTFDSNDLINIDFAINNSWSQIYFFTISFSSP